jgi:hypothetical protein
MKGMSVVAMPSRALIRAWAGLVGLGAATSLVAAVAGSPPIPVFAAALVLGLAWGKARLILRRYLGLAAAPSWRGGVDAVIGGYLVLLFVLFLLPALGDA